MGAKEKNSQFYDKSVVPAMITFNLLNLYT